LLTAILAQQAQFGTAAEAKAMLERAVAAVKADKDKAIKLFITRRRWFLRVGFESHEARAIRRTSNMTDAA